MDAILWYPQPKANQTDFQVFLISAYNQMKSIDRIQYPNLVTHQFVNNDDSDILIAVVMFDVNDADDMILMNLVMVMSIHNNPNKWNRWIVLIVV